MNTQLSQIFDASFNYYNESIGHWSDFDCNGVHVSGINIKNTRMDQCFSIVWDMNADKYSLYNLPIDIDDPLDHETINLDYSNLILNYVDLQKIIEYLEPEENENNDNQEEEDEQEQHHRANNQRWDDEAEDEEAIEEDE